MVMSICEPMSELVIFMHATHLVSQLSLGDKGVTELEGHRTALLKVFFRF